MNILKISLPLGFNTCQLRYTIRDRTHGLSLSSHTKGISRRERSDSSAVTQASLQDADPTINEVLVRRLLNLEGLDLSQEPTSHENDTVHMFLEN